MHPDLADYYDYKIFLESDEQTKHQRILERSGEANLKRFIDEWIPLENRYFENMGIKEKCDLFIDTTELF